MTFRYSWLKRNRGGVPAAGVGQHEFCAAALNRPLPWSALATQKYASPTASCAAMSSPCPAWWTTVAPKAA
jgi:hypothetical protein